MPPEVAFYPNRTMDLGLIPAKLKFCLKKFPSGITERKASNVGNSNATMPSAELLGSQ
jgi:hypothetical protein